MIRLLVRQRPLSAVRSAFTIVEMFCILVLLGVMIGLLLPAVQSAREMARRTSCANNLTQVALAMHNYHSAFEQLPTQLSGTDGSPVVGMDNDRRLSCFVALLPFLEMPGLQDSISRPLERSDSVRLDMWYLEEELESAQPGRSNESQQPWVAGGPEPSQPKYVPWRTEPPALRCPSDPGTGTPALARTNYAVCLGDGVVAGDSGPWKEVQGDFVTDPELVKQTTAAMRGVFVPRVTMRLSDVTDGLSSTLMLGEIATGLGDRDRRTEPAAGPGATVLRDNPSWARENGLLDIDRPRFWDVTTTSKVLSGNTSMRRGFRWADGMPLYTAFNTILPPNREITLRDDRDDGWGILPLSSRHPGGAQSCFADGAVRYITDSIEAGDERQPTVYDGSPNVPGSESPYGLWGALGTRSSHELAAYSFSDSGGE